jgi:hypothetical protein
VTQSIDHSAFIKLAIVHYRRRSNDDFKNNTVQRKALKIYLFIARYELIYFFKKYKPTSRIKITLLAAACLSLSPITQASSHFDGFYIGAAGGILNSFTKINSTTNANFVTTNEGERRWRNLRS